MTLELYNITNDRAEQRDLAKKQPEKVAELAVQLNSWIESVDTSNSGADYLDDK